MRSHLPASHSCYWKVTFLSQLIPKEEKKKKKQLISTLIASWTYMTIQLVFWMLFKQEM